MDGLNYKELAKDFVNFYYSTFNGHFDEETLELVEYHREELQDLYHDGSIMTHKDKELMGMEDIMTEITKDGLQMQVNEWTNFNAQPAGEGCVLIIVQGDCYFMDQEADPNSDDFMKMHFTEVFIIGQDEDSERFLIHNQVFSTQGV